jgi:transcriptional regulator with XRE-family HTH domain
LTGKQLQRERKARGLSIRELAKLSGVSASAISYLERGTYSARGATLRKLLGALKKAPKLPELD